MFKLLILFVIAGLAGVAESHVSSLTCEALISGRIITSDGHIFPKGYRIKDSWLRWLRRGIVRWPPPRSAFEKIPTEKREELLSWYSRTLDRYKMTLIPSASIVPGSSATGFLRTESRVSTFKQRNLKATDPLSHYDDIEIHVNEYNFVPQDFLQPNQRRLKAGTKEYQSVVRKFMDLVIRIYSLRRNKWPPEFLEGLNVAAFDFADRTRFSFPIAYQPQDYGKRSKEIGPIGTIRNIIAYAGDGTRPDQNLPMEKSLGMVLPFNGGIKIEVGSFTILKKYNKPVFGELMVSMVRDAQWIVNRKNHEVDKDVFYTYADDTSFEMYTSETFGFTPVPGAEPIKYAGTTWTLVASSAEKLIGLRNRLAKTREHWSADEASIFSYIIDQLEGPQLAYWGSPPPANQVLVAQTPFTYRYEKSPRGMRNVVHLMFRNDSEFGTNFGYDFWFPKFELPMKEGQHIQETEMGIDFVYSGGFLEGTWTGVRDEKHHVRISVNPYLIAANQIDVTKTDKEGKVILRYSTPGIHLEK